MGGAPRIVWADDNADNQAYVRHLVAHHYDVLVCPDGAEALDAARKDRPDLVLTAVMMPRLDGFGLLRELREDPLTRTVPVILLSGAEKAALEGLDAGADDYLVQPFSADALLARVQMHLEQSRSRRACAAELELANQDLEALTYSVSHDLRAPLRAIDGFSKALVDEYAAQFDDQARHYLARVRGATQRMGTMIEDLLNLSRLNRNPILKEPIQLTDIARGVIGDLRQREPSRNVAVEIEEGLCAHGDPRLIVVALENLLGNAWKFTSKRSNASIVFGQEKEGHRNVFYVRDNGTGFDMTYAEKLFAPFQRLHKASEFEGTGIGLATVSRIISRHGGRVWADAAPDTGATFFFTLEGIK